MTELKEDVLSEADVEQRVIYPLLTDINLLAIPPVSVKAKDYLSPAHLDKTAGKTSGYFPDFSIWEKSLPIMIVEAKAPEVDAAIGYRDASLYARHINQAYKSGLNPCQLLLSSNGKHLLAGHWDSGPVLDLVCADLVIGSSALQQLKDFCHHEIIVRLARLAQEKLKVAKATRPYSKAGGQAILNAKKPFNTFAADLSPVLRRYFTSTTQNSDREIYEKGYVSSDDVTAYDRILEALLKDRLVARRGPLIQDLTPTRTKEPILSGAISTFKGDRPPEGQLQLITGGVGTGKSLFARRYKELLQSPEQAQWTHWSFVDFNAAPPSLEAAEDWLCEQFVASFLRENPKFDPYDNENIPRVFSQDLQRRKGIYEELRKIGSTDADRARVEDLKRWQEDPRRLAFGICRYFSGDRREVVVAVMDNVDRLDLKNQLAAFQLSLWFMDQTKAFIILQMRDETYERFKDQPPLDTFRTGVAFHISPPRFLDVVKRRLELSFEYLARNTAQVLEYVLTNGFRIVYPNSMLGEFLKGIYLELFEKRMNVSRILQGLAGRDVRRALEMFVSILNSGHLREDAITSQTRGAREIAIPEYIVLRILMRTEYRFFSETSGFVSNLLHFEETWERPNNFILPEILFWLSDNRKSKGQIGLEGYFSVEHICDVMQLRGFVREDILAASIWMLKKHLIEADHMNHTHLTFGDSVKVTASGYIHLRVLCERMEYVYSVLGVTPITDPKVADRIADYMKREDSSGLSGFQMGQCVEGFLVYLKSEYDRLSAAYPEFGGLHSGAAYLIGQVESALAFFKNPTGARVAPSNRLDT